MYKASPLSPKGERIDNEKNQGEIGRPASLSEGGGP